MPRSWWRCSCRANTAARWNHAEANGWLARARDLAPEASAAAGWVRLSESEAESDPARVLELALEALDAGRRLRDPDLELGALGRVGLAEIWLGRIDEGMTRFDQAMAASAAGEPRDLRTLGDLYCTLMLAAELTLEADRFEQWNRRVFGYLQRYRHPDVLTFCGTCCAQVLVAGGDLAEGERWLTDTLASLEASGQQARCVHPATRLASLRVEQGRLEEAEELLRGSEDLPEAVQPMVTLYLARRQTALAAARLHRRLNQLGPGLATRRAAPRPAGGRPARAGRPRGRIGHRRRAGRRGHPVGSERFGAASDLALGSVAAAAARCPRPRAAWTGRSSCSRGTTCRSRPPRRTWRWPAASPRRTPSGRSPRPGRRWRRSNGSGPTCDADTAAEFLRELGVGGRTGPKLVGELSRREVEVLRLLGYGLTNAEIAVRLFISTKTVATHVGNIFAKLHVRNRAGGGHVRAAVPGRRRRRDLSSRRRRVENR